MKKTTIIILSLIMILHSLGATGPTNISNATTVNTDIIVDSFTQNPTSNIRKDTAFDLTINLKDQTVEQDLANVFVIIDSSSSSFYIQGQGTKFPAQNLGSGNWRVEVTLIYNGGSSNILPINIEYKYGSDTKTIKDYIGIRGLVEYQEPVRSDPTPPTPVDTTKFIPNLQIQNRTMPMVNAGNNLTLPITIENTSSYTANNIVITPVLDGSETPAFIFNSLNPRIFVSKIEGNKSEKIDLNFRVDKSAQAKVHPLKLNFRFLNQWNDPFEVTKTIYINVVNYYTPPKLTIEDIQITPEPIYAGENFDISFVLNNIGAIQANNIEITLLGLKNEEFTMNNLVNKRFVQMLHGRSKINVHFPLYASDKMKTGSYSIDVKVDYNDEMNNKYSDTYQIFLKVEGEGTQDSTKTTPKIIIDNFTLNPSIARAGEEFDLTLKFLNTNNIKSVRNVKIFLTGDSSQSGNVFTPINSSNTFFIDYIEPKSVVEKRITFYTIPDAQPKTYTITANFEYEDNEGNSFTASDLIGIPVAQQTRLDVSDFAFPPEVFVGNPVSIFLEFYNTGRAPLYNLMVKVQGNFHVQNPNLYVGNFERGYSDYFDVTIFPNEPGQVNGSIIFTYEDPTGKPYETIKEFTFNVIDAPAFDHFDPRFPPGYFEPEPPPQPAWLKLAKNKYTWITLTLVIAAIIGFSIYRNKLKKKGLEIYE